MSFTVMLRAGLVLVVVLGLYMLLGAVVKQQVDTLYRRTGLQWVQNLFYWLSTNRYLLGGILCIVVMVLFSGWILRPCFNGYARFIKESICLEGEPRPVALPKDLAVLEGELNDINRELLLWRYAVKEAEQRKDDLVVYLAHDIRTPLTSVLGYLELLEDSPELPVAQRQKYTAVALRKARRMQLLVEDLFEVTRYNISQIELEKQLVSAGMMLQQLAEEMQPLIDARQVQVTVEQSEQGPLFADPEKLARALDNILHNAVYYTPPGGRVTAVATPAQNGTADCIEITNSGADISPDKLQRFFEKFYRGDEARQSGGGGSGLGLAIAKNIIEAHGGFIEARSENGLTSFTVTLPKQGQGWPA